MSQIEGKGNRFKNAGGVRNGKRRSIKSQRGKEGGGTNRTNERDGPRGGRLSKRRRQCGPVKGKGEDQYKCKEVRIGGAGLKRGLATLSWRRKQRKTQETEITKP